MKKILQNFGIKKSLSRINILYILYPKRKKNRIRSRVEKFILSKLDFSKIDTTIDWDCGGGFFAEILSHKTKLILADISNGSLQEDQKYIGKDLSTILIPMNIESFKFKEEKIDLLFCHTVIHHFPSIEYWYKVFDIWTQQIKPTYFAIQIKIGEETTERHPFNYYEAKNYLNSLYLNEKEFVERFAEARYENTYINHEINHYKNPVQTMKVGYFIFKKL